MLISFTILFSDLVVTLGFCCILGLPSFGWCLVFVDYVIWFSLSVVIWVGLGLISLCCRLVLVFSLLL